jgi:amino acid adenylation domain-containing protein
VLPNGPELAVAALTIAAGATCAPLNPAYGVDEYAFHLTDLGVQTLIVQHGSATPARVAAQAHGVRVVELYPHADIVGLFTLTETSRTQTDAPPYATPDDVAFVMHTSGTTARAKIVPLTHSNICVSAQHMRTALGLTASDRYLSVAPLFHCAGLVLGVLASWTAGASVIGLPGFNVAQFFDALDTLHPTWYMGVSAMHQALVAEAAQYRDMIARSTLRFIRAGAVALPASVQDALERTFNIPVIAAYGMTETNVVSCNPFPPRPRKPGSVGVPAGPEVAIVDADGALLPAGVTGEIVVRGPNVMAGYERNPTANLEAFAHGWFHTGDEGFLDAEGYLFITGRLKEMINRGGLKVTPQEVDDVLMQHPAVAQAATFPALHPRWGEDVTAAVVLRPQATVTARELRRFVATRLAMFKVPSRVLLVEAIPLSPTGKLQRYRLAAQLGVEASALAVATPAGPLTPLAAQLTQLWGAVLGLDEVGLDDNFFQWGGDSILATQLLSRIREATQVEVPVRRFFESPTVAEVAQYITTYQPEASVGSPTPLQAVPRNGPLPLSAHQQRLWFLEHLGLSRHAYHVLEAVRLQGPLQEEALTQSLQALTERHEVLRTTFITRAGQPWQVIGPVPVLPLSLHDLQTLPVSEHTAAVQRLAQADLRQPFDLTHGPLLRVSLVRLAAHEHVLLLTMHHLVSDGWSQGIFWRELAQLYAATLARTSAALPPLPLQYADIAYQQYQALQHATYEAQLAYWRQQLAGVTTLQLLIDHPRPALPTFQGARQTVMLSPMLTQALKALSQEHGVTLFMTLLAAFQTLLQRYTGQDDIAVGSLMAQRNRLELEGIIGFLVNTLVLRTDLSGDPPFRTLLARVRSVTLDAYVHQDIPYEKLLEDLRPPRDLRHNPLFQVLFVLHNTPPPAWDFPGLTVQTIEIDPGTARFDVALECWETPEGLRCRFEYSTDLFEAPTIARMAGHWHTLLAGIAADVTQPLSRLPLLTAAECQRMLSAGHGTEIAYHDTQCLHDVFTRQAQATPEAVAVCCGDDSLTYDGLNRRANQVAYGLQARGIGPGALVGLCIARSLDMVVGLLGILKSGAAYLPLDPTYPAERLAFMLTDAQPALVLTQAHLAAALPVPATALLCLDTQWSMLASYGDDNPVSTAQPDDAAYLLYTSGSTGQPKGVVGLHRATMNALAWMWQTYPHAATEVCCQKTPISFGDSLQELFGPLLHGTPLVLIPDDVLRDLPRWLDTLARHRVTRMILVPSLLRTLLETFPDLQHRVPHLTLWFAGGEALPTTLVQRFRACLPHGRLINLYGASEASDDTTWYDTSALAAGGPSVPIGRPIANTQVYVLDQHQQPVPHGVAGELYVGGAGLTRGYLHQPALTAERFVPHPWSQQPGARLYKTGDLVRTRYDGHLEYLGRLDQQIKLRGIRMELGEVEAALAQHAAVREAAVMVSESSGEAQLVAYIAPVTTPGPTIRELRQFLTSKLPLAMVPAHYVLMPQFPLTPSGKVDRRVLPAPVDNQSGREEDYVAPRTACEQQVAALWELLLGRERVGLYDDFFELGGHSLLAMQFLARLRDATQVDISLVQLFAHPTVAALAARLEAGRPAAQLPTPPALLPVSRTEPLHASLAQEQFWLFEQMLPGLPLFNIPYVVQIHGDLDVAVLRASLRLLVQRHEALRTTFTQVTDQLYQVIAPTMSVPLMIHDLRDVPAAQREAAAQRYCQAAHQQPFDLSQGPLWRGYVLHMAPHEARLLLVVHHIISDGWSLGVLMRELVAAYEACQAGVPAPLPPLPIQYADFAAWQRQGRHHPALRAQLAYWRAQLHPPLPALALATDCPRSSAFQVCTARQTRDLASDVWTTIVQRSQEEGGTPFMTCLAALYVVLHGSTGAEDVCVATLVANRTRPETEHLLGLVINTLLLRTSLSGNPSGRELLQRVQATTLAAYAHQDLPFEEVVRMLEQEQQVHRTALGQVLVVWQNAALWPLHIEARTLHFETLEQYVVMPDVALTSFDIILTLRERPQGLTLMCLYKTDLFTAETIIRFLDRCQDVLARLSAQPMERLTTLLSH